MYIYKSIITGSLGLKIVLFLNFLAFIILFAILFRRLGVFNTISQIAQDINNKIIETSAYDVYANEKQRLKVLFNPVSVLFTSVFEEFEKVTSYDIIETKLLRIKNVITQGENDTFEFLNKFQRILFTICILSPLIGIFFILFSFSDLFIEIGLNGNQDYSFFSNKIGNILFIGVSTIFTSLVSFAIYIFLNYKTIALLKTINNFALFLFNFLSFELEKKNPNTIIKRYKNNQFQGNIEEEFESRSDNEEIVEDGSLQNQNNQEENENQDSQENIVEDEEESEDEEDEVDLADKPTRPIAKNSSSKIEDDEDDIV